MNRFERRDNVSAPTGNKSRTFKTAGIAALALASAPAIPAVAAARGGAQYQAVVSSAGGVRASSTSNELDVARQIQARILKGKPIKVAVRSKVVQYVRNPDTSEGGAIACSTPRPPIADVHGEPYVFGFKQTDTVTPDLGTLEVYPIGPEHDVELAPIAANRYRFTSGKQYRFPNLRIVLDSFGMPGVMAHPISGGEPFMNANEKAVGHKILSAGVSPSCTRDGIVPGFTPAPVK